MCALIGMAVMAGVDEIVFHQLLGWHHFYDRSTTSVGLLSDGLLHTAELLALVAGFFLLRRPAPPRALVPAHARAGFLLAWASSSSSTGSSTTSCCGCTRSAMAWTCSYDWVWNLGGLRPAAHRRHGRPAARRTPTAAGDAGPRPPGTCRLSGPGWGGLARTGCDTTSRRAWAAAVLAGRDRCAAVGRIGPGRGMWPSPCGVVTVVWAVLGEPPGEPFTAQGVTQHLIVGMRGPAAPRRSPVPSPWACGRRPAVRRGLAAMAHAWPVSHCSSRRRRRCGTSAVCGCSTAPDSSPPRSTSPCCTP